MSTKKSTCSRDTSASSTTGVLNSNTLYNSTHSITHSLTQAVHHFTDKSDIVYIKMNKQSGELTLALVVAGIPLSTCPCMSSSWRPSRLDAELRTPLAGASDAHAAPAVSGTNK